MGEVSNPRRPLRLWPGVLAVSLQWFFRFVLPVFAPEMLAIGVMGGVIGGLLVLVWWLFFSRAPWSERLGAVAIAAVALFVTSRLVDRSIATGAMGMLFPIMVAPIVSLAFVLWAVASRNLSNGARWATMATAIMLGCGVLTTIRTGGFTGDFKNDLNWRWAKTPEERLLAKVKESHPPPAAPTPVKPESQPQSVPAKAVLKEAPVRKQSPVADENTVEWPGFRGPRRDGVIRDARIQSDWSASPPAKLWSRQIGPGWSSFAVRGDFLYTQEQRGPEEVVSCYRVSTGEPVWTHSDTARFWEANAGPGPRATPTLEKDRLYTFGATGIVNALNAADGSVVWTRNAAAETDAKTPDWGFASSPLLFQDSVIVAVSGQLVAYDLATGAPRWLGPKRGTSYSSPQLFTKDGVTQIVLLSSFGAVGVAPIDGKLLWEHAWKGYPIVQPALTEDGDVLISVSDSSGIRRLGIAHDPNGWKVEERWTSVGLKPYFNDFVLHKGFAFGFDGSILSCIDLKDGARKWKGGRYGHGQLVLLPDQDLLLVLSEEGELALVKAAPEGFTELGRIPAIEGKTWNHPVLAGGILLARNGEEMAAFKLAAARQ